VLAGETLGCPLRVGRFISWNTTHGKLPEKIAASDEYDFAYDYNYDMTEDDNYCEHKI
jgi:hypothetical protein